MPNHIKLVIMLLIGFAVASPFVTYMQMEMLTENNGYDPFMYTMDFAILGVVCWLIWDIKVKKKNVKFEILAISLIWLGFIIWDFSENFVSAALYLNSLMSILLFTAFFLLGSKSSRGWFEVPNT